MYTGLLQVLDVYINIQRKVHNLFKLSVVLWVHVLLGGEGPARGSGLGDGGLGPRVQVEVGEGACTHSHNPTEEEHL